MFQLFAHVTRKIWASPSTNWSKVIKTRYSFQKSIPAAERLALTLRFLASGDSQKSLSFAFRIEITTLSNIIKETCIVLNEVLTDEFVKPPRCETDLLEITRDFEEIWSLPNVVGALDGKHIQTEATAKSGTLFHNYKWFFNIVLPAICDANYCFTLVDIGLFGSNNDSGVWANSSIRKQFREKGMKLPVGRYMPGCPYSPLPCYLLGDEIFSLKSWLMKSFPGTLTEKQSIYNYRHSRPKRATQNSFVILGARW